MASAPVPPAPLNAGIGRILPGLALAAAVAVVATLIGSVVPLVGSAVPGIVLGVLLGLVLKPGARLRPGITFASKFVLQLAVVLLGAQLSLAQIGSVGLESLPVMLGSLVVCLVAAWLIGRALGVVGDLRTLIGVGTAICGASAIAAVAPVIGAVSAEIAYAVSTIFLFNISAVIVFPVLGHLLGLEQHTFGLFAGTAVNDTSSVVATASVYGTAALGFAVVVKLVRTLMIIPITVALSVYVIRTGRSALDGDGEQHMRLTPRRIARLVPWFLIGFLLVAVVNSLGLIPDPAHPALSTVSVFLIATALSAIGLSTDLPGLRRAGWRPLALGGLLWLVVTGTSLAIIAVTG